MTNNPKKSENSVSFSVDAGIINRLGKELVGKAETAVSELIKNAYDADATLVDLKFIDTDYVDGEIHIIDNGNGMTHEQLIRGFMRLSSSDKIHNPVSPTFGRVRAGRKGIGRFATQRIGSKLRIITKAENEVALMLDVDWSKYEMDQDLSSIANPITEVDVDFPHGTKLIISDVRDFWTEAQIKRVFRFVTDLLQPAFLSDRSHELNLATEKIDESFIVRCSRIEDGDSYPIADLDKMVFDNALGIIEGTVIDGQGSCRVMSRRFIIDDKIEIAGHFKNLNDLHFKAYYFIYSYEWYENFIPKMEYNKISELGESNGGIRLYRNGFRVLPYGERGNDWLNIDKTSIKAAGRAHVPFSNQNFFGFVEVIDPEGKEFEETSSREGLIENDAFRQLSDFVNKSLRQGTQRINSSRLKEKEQRYTNSDSKSQSTNTKSSSEYLEGLKTRDKKKNVIIDLIIDELELLRILAGIGLNISEFTHEIRQFMPSFNGSITYLLSKNLGTKATESLTNLQENFNRFRTYTSYIDHTITQSTNREKIPVEVRSAVRDFRKIIQKDLDSLKINLHEDYFGYDLFTCRMHPAEWTSILYNLYTNSKKAIERAKPNNGKIMIISGREDQMIYLEFLDNGDGIPKENKNRIFDPFFTTSTPASHDATKNESITGTGLGLKIVNDIVKSYQGQIELASPERGYVTCFRIEVPIATENELEKYGY